jgi:hypothetical protein
MDLGVIVEISSRDDELLIRGGVNRDLYWTQTSTKSTACLSAESNRDKFSFRSFSSVSVSKRWRVPRVGSLSSTVLSIYRPVVG